MSNAFILVKSIPLKIISLSIIFAALNVTSHAAAYNSDQAVAYAEKYWIYYNTKKYKDEPKVDCSNFVSQCLIAGGLKLNDEKYLRRLNIPINNRVGKGGTLINCDDLHKYLAAVYDISIINEKSYIEVPVELKPGDVIIFGDNHDPYRHATIVVEVDFNAKGNVVGRGEGLRVKLAAHDTDHNGEVGINWFMNYYQRKYGSSVANYYLMSTVSKIADNLPDGENEIKVFTGGYFRITQQIDAIQEWAVKLPYEAEKYLESLSSDRIARFKKMTIEFDVIYTEVIKLMFMDLEQLPYDPNKWIEIDTDKYHYKNEVKKYIRIKELIKDNKFKVAFFECPVNENQRGDAKNASKNIKVRNITIKIYFDKK